MVFVVVCGGFFQGIGVEFDYCVQVGFGMVQGGDVLQVGLGQGGVVQFIGGYLCLQVGNIGFGVWEWYVVVCGFGCMCVGCGWVVVS